MTVYIKNMVCMRCIMAVQAVLEELDIKYNSIELGLVHFNAEPDAGQLHRLASGLKYYELELLDNKRKVLVERIKILILDIFQSPNDDVPNKFSEYLSTHLHREYNYLANIFSEIEGSTIERFYIQSKIDRVKQLLVYEGLSIKEIAFQLNYSSESHLCKQFKKMTGQTPSLYKRSLLQGHEQYCTIKI